MPIVLIPLHFDRDPVDRKPSAQRSIVLRPFITNDFMTGVPVIPGSDKLPMNVSFFDHFSSHSDFQLVLFSLFRSSSEWFMRF